MRRILMTASLVARAAPAHAEVELQLYKWGNYASP